MIAQLVAAEHEKVRTFWSEQSARMLRTFATPLFGRLHQNDVRGMDLRHLHNRFGWQAGNNALCVGAFYRAEQFIRLPDDQRCGTRIGRTIHIEHTVPIATLTQTAATFERRSPEETIVQILAKSVVTAAINGKIVKEGMTRSSHAFTTGHSDEGLPFRRYKRNEQSPIWDVINQRPIDPDRFTFSDHQANLAIALGWAGLDDWAQLLDPPEPPLRPTALSA